MSELEELICGSVDSGEDQYRDLRIGAVFIILVGSGIGTIFPLVAKRTVKLPVLIYE